MDSSDQKNFRAGTSHTCARETVGRIGGIGAACMNGGSRGFAPICVCLEQSWVRIRRPGRCRRVRRISILARSSVCSDIWSISIWCTWRVYGSHLLRSPHPRRPHHPQPPPRNGHARCRRLCKRSLSTLWVEVYG